MCCYIVRLRFDGVERLQIEQSPQLCEGELAVRINSKLDLRFDLYNKRIHHFVYCIDCLTLVFMLKKSLSLDIICLFLFIWKGINLVA